MKVCPAQYFRIRTYPQCFERIHCIVLGESDPFVIVQEASPKSVRPVIDPAPLSRGPAVKTYRLVFVFLCFLTPQTGPGVSSCAAPSVISRVGFFTTGVDLFTAESITPSVRVVSVAKCRDLWLPLMPDADQCPLQRVSLSLSLSPPPPPLSYLLASTYVCREEVRGSGWVGYHFSKLCGRGIKWDYARSLPIPLLTILEGLCTKFSKEY